MHIYVTYIREIKEEVKDRRKERQFAYLSSEETRLEYFEVSDKNYEAKHAMFIYFCYFVMESENVVVTIVKQSSDSSFHRMLFLD